MDLVLVRQEDFVGTITLDNPKKRNALSKALIDELVAAHPPLTERLEEMAKALIELDLRRSTNQDLQLSVMKARVRELMDHNPPKADALKACFVDATDQLKKKMSEIAQARALALEAAGIVREAIAGIRGKWLREVLTLKLGRLEGRIGK